MSGKHDALVEDLNKLLFLLKEQHGTSLNRADDPTIYLDEEIELLELIIKDVS
jgi:hypothetical protein